MGETVYSLSDKHNETSAEETSSENVEKIISLRLPASLLATMDASSEIGLHSLPNKDTDDTIKGIIRRKRHGDQCDAEEELTLRLETVGQSDVYRSSYSSRTALVRVGSTSKRCTGRLASLTEVKDLGRKARERLAEEKSKRREIVRLDKDPDEITTNSPGINMQQTLILGQATKKTPKKKGTRGPAAKKRRSTATKSIGVDADQPIDYWTPDVSHLPILSKEERSNVVRMHGLPLDVRPEQIMKFFSGLDPERVFVIPSHSIIHGWDSRYERRKPSQKIPVARHSANFRVFVKFRSAPLAEMATSRSGEVLFVESNDEAEGAVIAVSQVSKSHAIFLLWNMAIDGISGEPLRDTLIQTEKQLASGVVSMLWTMTLTTFELRSIPERCTDDQYPWEEDLTACNASELQGYQRLAKCHNMLIREYEKLECTATCLLMHAYDPAFSRDPIIRLTSAASSFLVEEIDCIQNRLVQARMKLCSNQVSMVPMSHNYEESKS